MGRIDHQAGSGPGLSRQLAEDLVKNPRSAPAYKPVVECLVRAIGLRRILPLKAVPDHIDDPADDPSIIYSRDTMRQGEIGRDPWCLLQTPFEQCLESS